MIYAFKTDSKIECNAGVIHNSADCHVDEKKSK